MGIDKTKNMDVWQMSETIGKKVNTYTMWVANKTIPARYEMMGYDTLFGSHYDKYYLTYTNFTQKSYLKDKTTFVPPQG